MPPVSIRRGPGAGWLTGPHPPWSENSPRYRASSIAVWNWRLTPFLIHRGPGADPRYRSLSVMARERPLTPVLIRHGPERTAISFFIRHDPRPA